MPSRLFRQRTTNRRFDRLSTATNSGAWSFHNRNTRTAAEPSAATIVILSNAQPLTRYDTSGKIVDREDAILYTDFDIPSYSKILGGYLQMTSAASSSGNLTNLHLAIYPPTPEGRDIDRWIGASPDNRGKFKWIHVPTAQRETVETVTYEADNLRMLVYEGVTVVAQTSSAAAATGSADSDPVGRHSGDRDDSSLRQATNEAAGNVIQVDTSSSAVDSVGIWMRKIGVVSLGNAVVRVYSYDATTHTIGALRATSDPRDAFLISTTLDEKAFTFSTTFSVTSGEYILVTLEPETVWGSGNDGRLVIAKYGSFNTAIAGSNPAGSKEIIWKKVLDIGNTAHYFFRDEIPCLYSGETGLTKCDTPYQNVIDISSVIGGPITTTDQVAKFPLSPKMLRALENYARSPNINQINGLQWYLGAGTSNTGTINWSIDHVQTTGVFLSYRSTRTFIT